MVGGADPTRRSRDGMGRDTLKLCREEEIERMRERHWTVAGKKSINKKRNKTITWILN